MAKPEQFDARDFTLSAAVSKELWTTVDNLARESFMSRSSLVNNLIIKSISEDPNVPRTTNRRFSIEIIRNKMAQIRENLRFIDEFYDFKVDLWQFCMLLNGKLGTIHKDGIGKCGIQDLTALMLTIKEQEPALYKECAPILKKTLNKDQLAYFL